MQEMMNEREEQTEQELWSSLVSNLQLTKCRESDAHFKDEIEKNRATLTIQPKFGGSRIQTSSSFIFEKNPVTGKVDLDYCSRKRNEKDQRKIYQNCTHFGIVFDEFEGTVIELTSEFSDSSFYLHCGFKRSYNLGVIMNSINRLIDTVLNENTCEAPLLIANNLNQESYEYQPSSSSVFPLCQIEYNDHKNDTTSVTSKSRGHYDSKIKFLRHNRCLNHMGESNHTESNLYMGAIMTAYAIN
jgi:hypothetical protein